METSRQPYPSDLTQEQWDLIAPFVPEPRPVHDSDLKYERREIINAIRYRVRTGCQWRYLPHDLPKWELVYHYFAEWTRLGLIEKIHDALRKKVRRASGKKAKATAGSIDSQTAKTSPMAETSGYDGGKKVKGRKRHLFVDTLGLVIGLLVTPANVDDGVAGRQLMTDVHRKERGLKKAWADGKYRGAFVGEMRDRYGLDVEITLGQRGRGFQVVPHRWRSERTFGWLGWSRGLSKDYERKEETEEAMIHLSMMDVMLKRLTHTSAQFG